MSTEINKCIVVFDTETNGLNPTECDILSLGWIKVKITSNSSFEVLEHVEYFVKNDEIHNNEVCLSINGITDEFRQQHGKPINEILDLFAEAIDGCFVYAYNVKFDVGFIRKYNPNYFKNTKWNKIDDVRTDYQSIHDVPVVCALQKTVYDTFKKFNHWVPIKYHLHTAYDDVYAELLILLHQKFNVNVSSYFVSVKEYEPDITTGPHQHKSLNQLSLHQVESLLGNTEPELEYLRTYLIKLLIKN